MTLAPEINKRKEMKKYLNMLKKEISTISGVSMRYCTSDVAIGRLIDTDALILYKKTAIAFVLYSHNERSLDRVKREAGEIIKLCKYQLGIIVYNNELYFRRVDGDRFSKTTTDKIVDEIARASKMYYESPSLEICRKKLIQIYNESADFKGKEKLRESFEFSCNNLSVRDGQVRFSDGYEDSFFRAMLGSVEMTKKVCRYTSVQSIFASIYDAKQSMCCLRSMNDPQEGYYADERISDRLRYLPRSESDVDRDNNHYLLSCIQDSKKDNLVFWRLYGDDAKGVCISYNVDHSKIDGNRFIFAPVNYGNEDGSHQELELIYNLLEKPISEGWYFKLDRWNIWRYFFKSFSYRDEKEIRLIYANDAEENDNTELDWYCDRSNGIINKRALFSIKYDNTSGFPLELDSIILGPNSPGHQTNVEQIMAMIDDKEVNTSPAFRVLQSKHKNYR